MEKQISEWTRFQSITRFFWGGKSDFKVLLMQHMQARESIMEFSPWAEELTTMLESRISNEIGRVVSVGDETAHVYGMNKNQS